MGLKLFYFLDFRVGRSARIGWIVPIRGIGKPAFKAMEWMFHVEQRSDVPR